MSAKSEARWRKEQARDLARILREQDRAKLAALRTKLAEARDARRERVRELRALCKAERVRLRARAARLREEARAASIEARDRSRSCSASVRSTRSAAASSVAEARAALVGERAGQREARRSLRYARSSAAKPLASSRERKRETDDEVRGNIPAELLPVWEAMRKSRAIQATDRMSRTEAFLQWVHDHSADAERLMYESHEKDVRRLEAEERAAARDSRKAGRYSKRRSVAALARDVDDTAIPF